MYVHTQTCMYMWLLATVVERKKNLKKRHLPIFRSIVPEARTKRVKPDSRTHLTWCRVSSEHRNFTGNAISVTTYKIVFSLFSTG
uniref:Uncharacterized protein n=1 Tax=Oryza brachyantha TaxID=4533 RepID=J3LSN8_ORYBR